MNKEEANELANHIAAWSANDQIKNHKPGLNPHVKPIGGVYFVVLQGRNNESVWSWQGWKLNYEPEMELGKEEEPAGK